MQVEIKDCASLRGARILVLIAMINALVTMNTCYGAPAAYDPRLEMKPAWQDNSLTPIIAEPCLTAGCWEWLSPFAIGRGNAEIIRDQASNTKLESQTLDDGGETNAPTRSWKSGSAIFAPRAKFSSSSSSSSSSVMRQMSPKPVKKDVFVSRSWGPGGLPFSVLYMNPHGARATNNRPTTGMPEVAPTKNGPESSMRRNFEGSAGTATNSSTRHSNNRVAVRNGSNSQPRRQYSIIPQLFISYGWGPLGK